MAEIRDCSAAALRLLIDMRVAFDINLGAVSVVGTSAVVVWHNCRDGDLPRRNSKSDLRL